MGFEGRTLQSVSRTDPARRPCAGRYSQSFEPRPRGTSFAGGRTFWGYAAAAACSRRQRNSLLSLHIRCKITASLRGCNGRTA